MNKFNYIIISVIFLFFSGYLHAQDSPPEWVCECCNDAWYEMVGNGEPPFDPLKEAVFENCIDSYCSDPSNSDCPVIPIDQNILLLLIAGIGLGSYKIYTQRKKATS